MPSLEQKNHFRLVQTFQSDYSPDCFTHYESERTGMRVVVLHREGPKVHGYFALATEIHNDSGAPHTLEHLCFMGSKNYPYKGFLDKVATRLNSNTNAWTAQDHTAYTLSAAGWEGFAQMLALYLDHIICPTLTDDACYTEVYHVDGTGNDAGVVYSEMQGVQNKPSRLIDLECRRQLYPEGIGFRYETGGMMEQLRVLTADQIREFHKKMYQPKNLCLIITGEVDHDNLLQVLDEFEYHSILDVSPHPNEPFKRPWVESRQIPPLEKSIVCKVEFPEADESSGEVEIRFLGPNCTDTRSMAALNVALLYLAGSPAAILENILVEKEHLASGVFYSTHETPRSEINFTLSSVATEKLAQVERRFFEVLKEAMLKIDMEYMRECIRRARRSWKSSTEASVYPFTSYIITDFLFGSRDGSNIRGIASLQEYDKLEHWDDNQWRDFIKQWISEAHHVSILGVPSAECAAKVKADNESMLANRIAALGKDGLKRLEERLEKAKAENGKEIPREDLAKFKVPGVETIPFIKTTTARSGLALSAGHPDNRIQEMVDSDMPKSELFMHFEHIKSNFIQARLYISTTAVPVKFRPLLAIYTEAYFGGLPVRRNGEKVPFEQVVVELEKDTVSYHMDIGAYNPEMLVVSIQAEPDKYESVISFINELSWNSIFDVERLKAITTRLLSDIPEEKRSGNSMVDDVQTMVKHTPESILRATSTLTKALYLKRIKHMLEKNPEGVVSQMEEIRKQLFRFENFRVLVIADQKKVTNHASAWDPFTSQLDANRPLSPIINLQDRLTDAAKNPGTINYIVPMTTIDSSYANTSAKGPDSYTHPKLPALMVAIAYMNAVEGPLWVAIRGKGLAYASRFRYNVDTALVHFQIYRSPNVYKAFSAGKKIVEDYLSGEALFDPLMALEGAISSIVVDFVNEQSTQVKTAKASFVRQVIRGLPSDYQEKTLLKVREVTIDDIKEALRDIILPLFTPGKSDFVVTCSRALEKPIKEGFERAGYKPEVRNLKSFEDDYGLKPEEGEEEEEEEEEEDEEDESGSGDDNDDDEIVAMEN
ncbi:hypothetical protein AJ78_01277 [Emergomyces pasteurianus Ep9510]|uniref:Mitochondrial presequence protease n=1 Tax=Emergomyces pasteurianus Ep9510 TaxID=1447872 RepID=A0A1J9QS81_9EURO|nr:hypothetical protein AJ78_01277 [Emergomyces pasteurianus Ep9510]